MLINRNKEPPRRESNASDSRLEWGGEGKNPVYRPNLLKFPRLCYSVKRRTEPFLGLK
jgi:hypothetical protein